MMLNLTAWDWAIVGVVFAVTLGPRILRAETAAVATLAIVQHIKGDLGRVD